MGRPWIDPDDTALLVDLYELTMAEAYLAEGLLAPAVFSLFFRSAPHRNYLVACGLDDALAYLEGLRFREPQLRYLKERFAFSERLLSWLEGFRFTGEVWALPEGTLVFPDEPLLEVRAPLPEAQLVETLIINQVHLETVLASKAARVVDAARGRPVVDFGLRRVHGVDAGLKAARACYIAGLAGTSNVLAGRAYGVPVTGTMAHSYIEAHASEADAFAAFRRVWPEAVLLVDTYDTLEGVERVIALATATGEPFRVRGVRLDSGDLDALSRAARRRLDEAGLGSVQILASGGLDEHRIEALVEAGAPIDAFGVGTSLGVSEDAPALDMAYKLAEYAGVGCMKTSAKKATLPGRKQVFRREEAGRLIGDVIARADEAPSGRPLLEPVMAKGRRLPRGEVSLEQARAICAAERERLPACLRALPVASPPYSVEVSAALARYRDEVRAHLSR